MSALRSGYGSTTLRSLQCYLNESRISDKNFCPRAKASATQFLRVLCGLRVRFVATFVAHFVGPHFCFLPSPGRLSRLVTLCHGSCHGLKITKPLQPLICHGVTARFTPSAIPLASFQHFSFFRAAARPVRLGTGGGTGATSISPNVYRPWYDGTAPAPLGPPPAVKALSPEIPEIPSSAASPKQELS